jgi:hypothetical protein
MTRPFARARLFLPLEAVVVLLATTFTPSG